MNPRRSLARAHSWLLRAWRPARVELRQIDGKQIARLLVGVLSVLALLELVYLAVGNAILRSSLVRQLASSQHGIRLEYDSAWTAWPGHVSVRGFRLFEQDYNVQLGIYLDRAELDVALTELPFRKFHATRVDATGTRIRIRHKLIVVGDDAERVRAYPPIAGFADPPYYSGVRPPPIPDSRYDLWQVRLDHVRARIDELWIMEYRYQGAAEARGSFLIRPARWVRVEPARLTFGGGSLRLGSHVVARRLSGQLSCDIPAYDVRATQGLGVLRELAASAKLHLAGGGLGFLSAYLERKLDLDYAGSADTRVDVNLAWGVVQPGSSIRLQARPLELRGSFGGIRGPLELRLSRPPRRSADQLLLELEAPKLTGLRAAASPHEPPRLVDLSARMKLGAVRLTRISGPSTWQLRLRSLLIPELGWFQPPGLEWHGRLEGAVSARGRIGGPAHARLRLTLTDASVETTSLSAADSELHVQAELTRGQHEAAWRFATLLARSQGLALGRGGRSAAPISLRLDADGARLALQPQPQLRGTLRVHASSLEAVLPLFLSSPLDDLAGTALGFGALDASTGLALDGSGVRLHDFRGRSGAADLRGWLRVTHSEQRGRLLISSGPVNVGVGLLRGHAHVAVFVGDDWLESD